MDSETYNNRKNGGFGAEANACERFGGVMTRGSGSGRQKGDFIVGKIMYEVKSTVRESIAIKKDWLTKVASEAIASSMSPRLLFVFSNGDKPVRHGSWVAMPESDYIEILERLENKNETI